MIGVAKRRAVRVVAGIAALALAGCLGGQSAQTKGRSDALGDQSKDVPPATLAEHDWKEAAKGHGAAGAIPAEDLARMEKRSAPGGNLDADAGAQRRAP